MSVMTMPNRRLASRQGNGFNIISHLATSNAEHAQSSERSTHQRSVSFPQFMLPSSSSPLPDSATEGSTSTSSQLPTSRDSSSLPSSFSSAGQHSSSLNSSSTSIPSSSSSASLSSVLFRSSASSASLMALAASASSASSSSSSHAASTATSSSTSCSVCPACGRPKDSSSSSSSSSPSPSSPSSPSSSPSSSSSASCKSPWHKVLYENQPYDDNFTPDSFLSSAVLNANVQRHTFKTIMLETFPITQQMACLALFYFVFTKLVRDQLHAPALMVANIWAFFIGYLIISLIGAWRPRAMFSTNTRSEGLVAYFASLQQQQKQQHQHLSSSQHDASTSGSVSSSSTSLTSPNDGSETFVDSKADPSSLFNLSSSPITSITSSDALSSSSSNHLSTSSSSSISSSSFHFNPDEEVAVLPPVGSDNGWGSLHLLNPFNMLSSSYSWVISSTSSSSSSSSLPKWFHFSPLSLILQAGVALATFASIVERVLIFLSILHMLAPLMRTLTLKFSEDTIAALSLMFSTIHIFAFDYDAMCATHPDFSGTVSLNAAVFASVLLASRLPTAWHVFAFLCFAFGLFSGAPMVLAMIRRASPLLHYLTSLLLMSLAALALNSLSFTLLCVYLLALMFVTLVSPAWLVYVQRYKNQIQGPWDYDDTKELDEL